MAITSRNPPQRQVLRGLGCTGKLPPLLSVVIYKYGVAPNPINKFPKPSWHPAALLWHCHHNLSAATAKISFQAWTSPPALQGVTGTSCHPWDTSGHCSGAFGQLEMCPRVPAAPSLPRCSPAPGDGTGKEKFSPGNGARSAEPRASSCTG